MIMKIRVEYIRMRESKTNRLAPRATSRPKIIDSRLRIKKPITAKTKGRMLLGMLKLHFELVSCLEAQTSPIIIIKGDKVRNGVKTKDPEPLKKSILSAPIRASQAITR
jgi:hypothetical protein